MDENPDETEGAPMTDEKAKRDKPKRISTKEELLEGRAEPVEVEISRLGSVRLRPLTDGQASELEAMRLQGQSLDGTTSVDLADIKFDMGKLTVAEAQSSAQAVAWSLVVEGGPLTVEEVGRMRPAGIVSEVAEEVYRVSGIESRNASRSEEPNSSA